MNCPRLVFCGAVALAISRLPAEVPVKQGAVLVEVAAGFSFTEGPAVDAVGNVYFTDQPNDRILLWRTDGTIETFLQPCRRSNGLFVDHDGSLVACADEQNQLIRFQVTDKSLTVLLDQYQGRRLNAPNDCWIDAKGGIYFSDPFIKRSWWRHDQSEQDAEAVYYLPKGEKNAIRVADGFKRPNGLVSDGRTMYIADLGDKKTYAYEITADGLLRNKRLFCEMGSDGMTLDEKGNVYLTGNGVHVFDRDGRKLGHLAIEGWSANVCFGGRDLQTLFITTQTRLYSLEMAVRGIRVAPHK